MSWVEWGLVAWSGAAGLWWLIALSLVAWRKDSPALPATIAEPPLTVFKPLPTGTTAAERVALAGAVESFLAQLEPGDELRVGVSEPEFAQWQPALTDWQRRYPAAALAILCRPQPVQRANPKIAWLEVLAPSARGDLWLWSDVDIVAPPGLLPALKRAARNSAGGAVTCAYCVRHVDSAAGMLDAAFVNAEFLPGALLLGRAGSLAFAFGAATLFRADDFRDRVNWDRLGAALADDYALGEALAPVALAPQLVETLALETTLAGALRHYYRWQKTIRWCRPASYAALLAILPLLGWAGLAVLAPTNPVAWLGLGLQWLLETTAVLLLCRAVRCRMSPGGWVALLAWPPIRALAWLAVWLPLPVTWRGAVRRWAKPRDAGIS